MYTDKKTDYFNEARTKYTYSFFYMHKWGKAGMQGIYFDRAKSQKSAYLDIFMSRSKNWCKICQKKKKK